MSYAQDLIDGKKLGMLTQLIVIALIRRSPEAVALGLDVSAKEIDDAKQYVCGVRVLKEGDVSLAIGPTVIHKAAPAAK